ncbi:MAG: ScbR family autoregulator-binding transcription factor [Actinomycetota bacterium]
MVLSAPPVTQRAESTRRCILEEAALAFAAHGYAGTSLNDVIKATGLTKGAFYFHFSSKEALALEVFRFKHKEWAAHAMAAAARETRALDRSVTMMFAACELHRTDPAARAVARLCWELGEDEQLAPKMKPFLTNWFDMLEGIFRQAQDEGDVRADVDVRALAETCVAAFIGIADVSHLLSENEDLHRRAGQLLDLILPTIRTTRRRTR